MPRAPQQIHAYVGVREAPHHPAGPRACPSSEQRGWMRARRPLPELGVGPQVRDLHGVCFHRRHVSPGPFPRCARPLPRGAGCRRRSTKKRIRAGPASACLSGRRGPSPPGNFPTRGRNLGPRGAALRAAHTKDARGACALPSCRRSQRQPHRRAPRPLAASFSRGSDHSSPAQRGDPAGARDKEAAPRRAPGAPRDQRPARGSPPAGTHRPARTRLGRRARGAGTRSRAEAGGAQLLPAGSGSREAGGEARLGRRAALRRPRAARSALEDRPPPGPLGREAPRSADAG